MATSNFFRPNDADRLWAYLDERQKELAKTDPFVSTLPDNKEIKAIGVFIVEALRHRKKEGEIGSVYFDVKDPKEPTDGVFRSVQPVWLTEDLREFPLYQTLSQDLSELIEWMVG